MHTLECVTKPVSSTPTQTICSVLRLPGWGGGLATPSDLFSPRQPWARLCKCRAHQLWGQSCLLNEIMQRGLPGLLLLSLPTPVRPLRPQNLKLHPPPRRARQQVFPNPTFPLAPEGPEGGDCDNEEWARAPGDEEQGHCGPTCHNNCHCLC